MRLLVVNVNTTAAMTDSIAAQARAVAAPGTEIIALTPKVGPEAVESNFDSYFAALGVMDAVVTFEEPFDAVIQAGFGEHGREGLQELLDVPVVDITEAAAHVAMMLGHKFSVVTTIRKALPPIEDRMRVSGLLDRCASIRASGLGPLELESGDETVVAAIAASAAEAVDTDGAEVIILGCGGMAGLAEAIQDKAGVPVVDPVAAGVKLAEAIVSLGVPPSKVNNFAPPRDKVLRGWPLSQGTQ